ncbi:MAG: hypothetical protein GY927_13605 [bacterium]|nr:hypothetical protein [bacterium]MCP4935203.1 hypothetical protein [bacterium]
MSHPFHPLHGNTYHLLAYKHTWGEFRVYYHDEAGKLCQVPAGWTDVAGQDPFVAVAAGRSPFRIVDLLELCRLIGDVFESANREEGCEKCVK